MLPLYIKPTNKHQNQGKKTALPWIEHNCFLLNKTENKQKQIKLWTAEWGIIEEFHLPSREFQEEIRLKRSGWDGFLFLDKIRALHLLGSKVTSQASTTSGPFNDVMGAKMVETEICCSHTVPQHHPWRWTIVMGQEWIPEVQMSWWNVVMKTDQKAQLWWVFVVDTRVARRVIFQLCPLKRALHNGHCARPGRMHP